MRRAEGVIATTHVDSEGDQLALEALNSIVTTIQHSYIPLWDEHDPRKPPIGRVTSASVRARADGEHEVVATIDLFDGTDPGPPPDDRDFVIGDFEEGFHVHTDRSFSAAEDRGDIEAIAAAFCSRPTLAVKKAIDPISILEIGGIFVAGAFFGGFFNKLGSDLADVVTGALKRLLARKRVEQKESILRFVFLVEHDNRLVEVDAFLTSPTDEDVEAFLAHGFQALDEHVPLLLRSGTDLRRLTFEFSNGRMHFRFAVRRDCVPLTLKP